MPAVVSADGEVPVVVENREVGDVLVRELLR
jgi:hypothetical protein